MFGSTNNAAKPTGGGLFGNSNGASNGFGSGNTGGLFGSNNNGGANTSSSNPSGGLFGGSNTSNTATTGGLFGSNNNASSGGLFGNNNANSSNNSTTANSGLFGNKSSTPSTGLFGNSTSATNTGGLFGKAPTSSTGGGLFGGASNASSAGLFGKTNSGQPTGGISANTLQAQTTTSLFGSDNVQNNTIAGTPPVNQYKVKDLPKSLTGSTRTDKIIQHSSSARKRSLSNSSATSIPPIQRSSILERLSTRFNASNSHLTYDSEGLFSPKKGLIQSELSPEKNQPARVKPTPRLFTSSSKPFASRSIRSQNSTSSEYLKLKVDTTRTEARRLKLFGESGGAQKVRILGRETESRSAIAQQETETEGSSAEANDGDNHKDGEQLTTEDPTEPVAPKVQDEEYWCSPSIEELSRLPLRQLSEVSDFTIGRKGYGTIRFEYPVDLTAFWSDLPGHLFGGVVKFNKSRTVEVYPDGSVPVGTGLNVPATITIEKVFPITKSKKSAEKDQATKDLEVRLFVKKLKELKDMKFVAYDPSTGSWTFTVQHFSIWGLVDEDAAVVDIEADLQSTSAVSDVPVKVDSKVSPSKKSSKPRSLAEDTFIYKKQKSDRSFDSTFLIPGSFIADDSDDAIEEDSDYTHEAPSDNILSDENIGQDDLASDLPTQLLLNKDDSLIFEEQLPEDIDEKQFEPEDVESEDFNILEIDPKVAVSENWDQQLELSSHFDSVFSNTSVKRTTVHDGPFSKDFTPGELDALLFGDFSKVLKSQNKIKKELRLEAHDIVSFNHDGTLISKSVSSTSGLSFKSLRSIFGTQNIELLNAIYENHSSAAVIAKRSNGFPKVLPNPRINFKLITDTYSSLSLNEGKAIWELASSLFDDLSFDPHLESIQDVDVSNRILEIKRRDGLTGWIKSEIQNEVDEIFENSNDVFEQIFLLLVTFEISNAAKLAIKTNNPHLAALVSLLGSNDPEVKFSATKQLQYWKSNASLQTIPQGLLKIYYLLQGDILSKDFNANLPTKLSWKAKLGLLLTYGNLNDPIDTLVKAFIESENINAGTADAAQLALLKLFVYKHEGEDRLNDVFESLKFNSTLDVTLQWYIFEILVRSSQQVTFGTGSAAVGDRLTTLFAEELLSNELYKEAIFVLSHLSNDQEAASLISKIVSVNIEKFSYQTGFLETLNSTLGVPSQLITEAKALHFRFVGDIWNEASCLLDAESYEEAHSIIITKVAPTAVINNKSKLDTLIQLINRFPDHHSIKGWSTGLAVYSHYIKFVRTNNETSLKYLLENLPLVKQTNFKIKVAVRLIAAYIANAVLDFSKENILHSFASSQEKILKLPLGEDQFYFEKQLTLRFYAKQQTLLQTSKEIDIDQ